METNLSPNLQGREGRRSERPLLHIPLLVEGSDADGKPFKERTSTVLINRTGARISLKNSVRPGDQITITNLLMRQSSAFRVVGRTETSIGQDPEWGVECLEPIEAFWVVIFPEKREHLPPANIVDALLECRECHVREMAKLVLDDYRELNTQGLLKRDCPKCRAEREWVLGTVDAWLEDADSKLSDPVYSRISTLPRSQRRSAKRYVVMLPVRIRHGEGAEEVTRTEIVSQMGMCFSSNLVMKEGDAVFLTVGDLSEDPQVEVSARIVWRRPLGGSKSLYGVRINDPKQK
jgi:hypothetical protein